MKNVKIWVSQILMVAMLTVVLSSSAMAGKPAGKGKCADGETKVKGVCTVITTDDGSSDTGSTGGGSGGGSTDGTCPEGMVWLDLYGFCVAI